MKRKGFISYETSLKIVFSLMKNYVSNMKLFISQHEPFTFHEVFEWITYRMLDNYLPKL